MKTVLLVDDEIEILDTLRLALEFQGYQAFTASNIFAATEILAKHKVHLLVTDFRMPGGDGIELLERAALSGIRPDKCIFMTGANESSSRLKEKSQIKMVLNKPFNLKDFISAVEQVI